MSCEHHTLIVAGERLAPPAGLSLTNFLSDDVHHFEGRARSASAVNELIIHESVTRSTQSTISVLKRRALGVHLIIAPDGHVTQHADLATARLAHAGGHNGPSVGLEVVTPYYPSLLRKRSPWRRVIDAPWAHKRRYVLPTPEQAEATSLLIGWLTKQNSSSLNIPRDWIGQRRERGRERLSLGRVKGADERRPGVYAHHYFGHADGAWLALYAWLRLESGLPPCVAYEEAVTRATGARRSVDISDLIGSEPTV